MEVGESVGYLNPSFIKIEQSDVIQPFNCFICTKNTNLCKMFEPYYFEGKAEIYGDLIFSCFKIELSRNFDESESVMICEMCIQRLREANSFKLQVENSALILNKLESSSHANMDMSCNLGNSCDRIDPKDNNAMLDIYPNSSNSINMNISETNKKSMCLNKSTNTFKNHIKIEQIYTEIKESDDSNRFLNEKCDRLKLIKEENKNDDCSDKTNSDARENPINNIEIKQILQMDQGSNDDEAMMSNKPKEKFKRQSISLEKKIIILDRIKWGEKFHKISKELNINESTIRAIKKSENKIRNRVSIGSLAGLNQTARVKNNLLARIENCLMMWIDDCRKKNIPFTDHVIKQKALKLFVHLKEKESDSKSKFLASKGWLEGFKKRFSLHNKIQPERSSTE